MRAMNASDLYTAQVAAVNAQRARVLGESPGDDLWGGPLAQRFRVDPRRQLGSTESAIASYVEPEDVVLDVGGGAGRIALPLALHCREVVIVDPSPGMRAQFEAAATEAGIANARFIQSDWLEAEGVQGDVAISVHVVYFIRDIVPFIRKLNDSARRRVVISIRSQPPPNRFAEHFRLVYGEPMELLPSYRELLPVLWEMGILPEVRVLPSDMGGAAQTQEDAVRRALNGIWIRPEDQERARPILESHFNELYVSTPSGFDIRDGLNARDLVITWETGDSA